MCPESEDGILCAKVKRPNESFLFLKQFCLAREMCGE
jgi:hypothetical protein